MIRVIQYGFGFIGQKAVTTMLKRKDIEVVGVIDVKDDYINKDIAEILGLAKSTGIIVNNNVQDTIKNVKADIVTNATVTYLGKVYEEIEPFIREGINVSSISEELAYPWIRQPEIAKKIDAIAKENHVTVTSSGVNPGFIMDLVPLTFASGCLRVDKIVVKRVVDFGIYSPTRGTRRFGVSAEQFRQGVKNKTIPLHTGLIESMTMISETLGWKLDNITDNWEPMISKSTRKTPWYTVEPGTICGFKHLGLGTVDGEIRISMEIYCLVHPNSQEDGVGPGDTVMIYGEPNIAVQTNGGPSERGDLCTASRLINIVPSVVDAKPGLLAVKDLPITAPFPEKEQA